MPNRRQFAKTSATVAATLCCPAFVRGQNLNSRLQIAGIGCDGKGWSDIREMHSHSGTQMVAFCDVDLARTERVRKLCPEAPVFQDYREMFESEEGRIDAVTVSTPDHTHAMITLAAMQKGKHVYCQKPLTHSVWEARQVAKQAKKSGVITRLGNQIHSHSFYRTAVAAINAGEIGKIKRVHSWCAATGHGKSGHLSVPNNPPSTPKTLDWDLWIGPAPMRAYGGDRVYHPFGWRDWQDFGNGALGDFGCHIFDPVFTALEIQKPPLRMKAHHTGMNDQVWPAQTNVDYLFPGTPKTVGETFEITWQDGGARPSTKDSHLSPTDAIPSQGSLVVGESGTLVIPQIGAPILYRDDGSIDTSIMELESLNHYHGWVDGCLGGTQPSDGFDYGALLTESVLLGNIAVRYPRQPLKWDEQSMQITNFEEANRWLHREERDGWKINEVA